MHVLTVYIPSFNEETGTSVSSVPFREALRLAAREAFVDIAVVHHYENKELYVKEYTG